MTTDEYCREIESYLCRKNDGHLIRIVGPSFERVCGWAAQGIPFKIVCQGIDACFVRYYAKGTRRRPVQIDFCENDILDAFDAWRRAVGVRMPGNHAAGEDASQHRQPPQAHDFRVHGATDLMGPIGANRGRNDDSERSSDAQGHSRLERHAGPAKAFVEHRHQDCAAADAEQAGEKSRQATHADQQGRQFE